MVVNQDHGSSVVLQSNLDDFPGVDACTIQGAPEQLVEGNDPVLAVQHQQSEDFVFIGLQQGLQVAEYIPWRGQLSSPAQA